MTLNADLANVMNGIRANAPPAVVANVEATLSRLAAARIGADAPRPGDKAPAATVLGADGREIALETLWRDQPLVLSFYRGRWCPYCDLTLRAFEAMREDFAAAGASMAAISPQTPEETGLTASERELRFPLYSDPHNGAAHAFGLAWQMNDAEKALAVGFGVKFDVVNGDESYELPAPATFIIDRQGVVRWAAVDPDFTKRAEPAEVLEALRSLEIGNGA